MIDLVRDTTHREESVEKKHNAKVCDPIYREQSAEMNHDIPVCDSIYRGQSAELKHEASFATLPTQGSLPR